jgi:selenocysteine lyase/cysteine desulfurase
MALPPDLTGEFPILGELAFFNHAGVAPLSRRAADALRHFASQAERFSYHNQGWYRHVREVKKLAAKLINADGEREIAFVANTSTGISTIAKGINWVRGDNVVITDVEYPSNRYPWQDLRRFGVEVIEARQQPDGRVDAEDLVDAVTDRTRIVAVSHVQYASGCRIDLKPISDIVHRVGGYLCVDAIQSLGALPVDVKAMGIDFLTADGHKWMLGPEGCGILYVKEDLAELIHPNVVGWMNMVNSSDYGNYQFEFEKDARRFEPGSYNLPGIYALGASLELILETGIETIWSRVEALTDHLCKGLKAKGYRVFSPRGKTEKSGIVTFEPPLAGVRQTPGMLQIVSELEKQGIVIVIREGKLRASPHFYNSVEQIDRLVDALP